MWFPVLCILRRTIRAVDYTRSILEESDSLTYGLDDTLSSIASKHEEHVPPSSENGEVSIYI